MSLSVHRMFRVCGPEKSTPTGTLTVMTDGPLTTIAVHMDAGSEFRADVAWLRVADQADDGVGSIVAQVGDEELLWFWFKELPVSGAKIRQSVLSVAVSPTTKNG